MTPTLNQALRRVTRLLTTAFSAALRSDGSRHRAQNALNDLRNIDPRTLRDIGFDADAVEEARRTPSDVLKLGETKLSATNEKGGRSRPDAVERVSATPFSVDCVSPGSAGASGGACSTYGPFR